MVYQTEKTLYEMGDKLDAADKARGRDGSSTSLKKALQGTDTEAIKNATEELTQAFYKVSEKMYQQANPQGAQGNPGAGYTDPGAQQGQQQGGRVLRRRLRSRGRRQGQEVEIIPRFESQSAECGADGFPVRKTAFHVKRIAIWPINAIIMRYSASTKGASADDIKESLPEEGEGIPPRPAPRRQGAPRQKFKEVNEAY